MGGLSIWHWLIVLVVVLLLFGTNKVSGLMGEFGKGIKNFKQSVADDDKKPDASMASSGANSSSLNAPLPDTNKTSSTVNQG
jgi:sec-independent protein translocase protein TatA